MPHADVQLLGGFSIRIDHHPLTTITSLRLQSLLAYLMLNRHTLQTRQHLAFLFWPDSSEGQARTNLRKQLLYLRRALPQADTLLQIDTRSVQWHPATPLTIDAADFARLATVATTAAQPKTLHALHKAVDLYRGDLLPDCYDDWILPRREKLREQYLSALEWLAQWHEDHGDYAVAIQYSQRLLRRDPLHEATYRRLMRLHAHSGDRAAALRVYHTCVARLEQELGVAPQPDTEAAHRRVLNPKIATVPGRQRPTERAGAAPFVGRQSEWQQLQRAWQRATRGVPHFALIAGEAGLGKTRLAEELLHWARHRNFATAYARSYAAEGGLAYAPVIEWLRTDALATPLRDLEDVWLRELARLLPELLTERNGLAPPEPVTQEWQRHRLFEALARAALTGNGPRLLVIDDLQWCDRETLEWLHFLLRFDARAQLLIVGTARPSEVTAEHPLTPLLLELRNGRQLTEIQLPPLDAAQTQELAQELAQQLTGQGLAPESATQLHRDTEGNPLFVIETMRAGERKGETRDRRPESREVGQATGLQSLVSNPQPPVTGLYSPLSGLHSLPPKIQAVIESRLAQLSAHAHTVANLAAVIGREFTFEVLAAACAYREDDLVRALDELWQRRIIREQGIHTYDFSHDKIREVAYHGVSPSYRRLFHRRVAEALETVYATDLDAVSGRLATHYERAGLAERAIQCYERAANVALHVFANREAVNHLTRALSLLHALPKGQERDDHELRLQTALGVPLVLTSGFGHSDVAHVYERAWELCQQSGDTAQRFSVVHGLWNYYLLHVKLAKTHDMAIQLLALAQELQDDSVRVVALRAMGTTQFYRGELTSAWEHLEHGSRHYIPQQHHADAFRFGHDSGVGCLRYGAWTLWLLGFPNRARREIRKALDLADELAHPFSQAAALLFSAYLYQWSRNPQAARREAEAVVQLSTQKGFVIYAVCGMIIRGWALAQMGERQTGVEQIQQGIDAFQTVGGILQRPYHLAILAEVYGQMGQTEKALAVLDEALAMMESTEESCYKSEVERLYGELLSVWGATEKEIERYLQQALDTARVQRAKSLELRAAISLSRLWAAQGKREQAHQLLAEIYGWFSEGFDTADLQAARALLDSLA